MKLIIGFIHPTAEDRVIDAIHKVPGVTGATFSDVRGFGRRRTVDRPVPEVLFSTARRVRFEVMTSDHLEPLVVTAIREAANLGSRGSGKVYVVELTRAVRIATGEEGEAAV
ncbi:MAG: P-II family nitrogen regulator [Gemmatimonadales bacterium]|nr:P-II family nitrogen regulator [Gemmatimonadales bacterium]